MLDGNSFALPWYRALQQVFAFINSTEGALIGSVLSVDTGAGLTGGPITTEGTISLAPIQPGDILLNTSNILAAPVGAPPARLTGVGTALAWANPQTITLTGDATGVSAPVDGSAPISITTVCIQAEKWTTARTLSLTGDATGSGSIDGSGDVSIAMTGVQAAKWTTPRILSFTGDLTGSGTVDGSADVATTLTLQNVVTAGTNTKITYDAKGLVTGGTQAAASDLSNGTTGSGAIVLADGADTTLPVLTVAALPTPTVGRQAMVSDSNASTFWAVVAGGGTTAIRVTADGTNWRIG